MARSFDDKDYLNFLRLEVRKSAYRKWKEEYLPKLDMLCEEFSKKPVRQVMEEQDLLARDVALFVRLGGITMEEAETWGLLEIERSVAP